MSLAAVIVTAPNTAETAAKAKKDKPTCAIRDLQQQVVLHTIYRENFDDIASTVGGLYSLAAENGIYPDGPLTFAYLNNFSHVSNQHWLTEIRLPVDKSALEVAGKLRKMTDVKTLSAMKVAVATKPEGMANSDPVYKSLYT